MRAIVLLALMLAACSKDPLPAGNDMAMMSLPDLRGVDLIGADLTMSSVDLGPRDLSGTPHACSTVADCRLYSSNCDPPGCECRALSKNEIDPVCAGNIITCFVDPCQVETRMLRCDNNMCQLL